MVWVACDPCPLALLIEATLAYVRYVASAAATVGSEDPAQGQPPWPATYWLAVCVGHLRSGQTEPQVDSSDAKEWQ